MERDSSANHYVGRPPVANNRKAEADRIAAEALKARNDAPFKAELEKAKQGTLPAP